MACAACLFGSYARGDADASSDIDVLLDGDDGFRLLSVYALSEDLRASSGKDVDVYELSELGPGEFRDAVLREAVAFSARPLRYEANRRLPPRAHRGDWRPAHRFSMTGSISRKLLLGDYRTQWMVTTPPTTSASRSLRSPTSSRPIILRFPGAASPGCGTDLCTTTKEPTGPSLRASRLTRYRLSLSKCRKSGGPFLIEPTVSARPTLPRSCPRARGGGRGRGSPWRRGRARCGRGLPPSRRRWCGSGNRS